MPPSNSASHPPRLSFYDRFVRWIAFDSDHFPEGVEKVRAAPDVVNFRRLVPFIVTHGGCCAVFWVGASSFAVWSAVVFYVMRMFVITGVNHRYFSHKTYSTSRFFQFCLAIFAGSTAQRGALWWAAAHRHHHRHSDRETDAHSPRVHGFWWSHMGWITSNRNKPTDYAAIPDLAKYPELVWLNRFDLVVPLVLAVMIYIAGDILAATVPDLHTNGAQLLVWAGFISTTALYHGTASINSFTHLFGRRRFATDDDSRNSFLLALIVFGEGWHNNHHRYQNSARIGFYWWELDIGYYGLKVLSWTGLIWDLKRVPESVLAEGRQIDAARKATAMTA